MSHFTPAASNSSSFCPSPTSSISSRYIFNFRFCICQLALIKAVLVIGPSLKDASLCPNESCLLVASSSFIKALRHRHPHHQPLQLQLHRAHLVETRAAARLGSTRRHKVISQSASCWVYSSAPNTSNKWGTSNSDRPATLSLSLFLPIRLASFLQAKWFP